MILSEAGRNLIKSFEGLSLMPYKDGGGVWTWGWGHAQGPHEPIPSSITEEQAEEIFDNDTGWAVDDVNSILREDVPQHVFDPLVSFVFNVGLKQLRAPHHRTLNAIVAQDWPRAADLMMNWIHDNGKRVPGLYNRRLRETQMLLAEVNEA